MNLSLMQPVLHFLEALAISSTVGIASYVLVRWTSEKSPETWFPFNAFIAIVAGGIALLAVPNNLIWIGGSCLIWALATFADRAVQPSHETWFETFCKFVVASTCATFVVFVSFAWMNGAGFWQPTSNTPIDESSIGYLMGGLLSPSVASIFLWMWKTILLRPGVDRHLKEGEEPR